MTTVVELPGAATLELDDLLLVTCDGRLLAGVAKAIESLHAAVSIRLP